MFLTPMHAQILVCIQARLPQLFQLLEMLAEIRRRLILEDVAHQLYRALPRSHMQRASRGMFRSSLRRVPS